MCGHSSSLKQRFTLGGFDTWCMKVRIIGNLREKFSWCGLSLGSMSYVTFGFFSYESGLFRFIIEKRSIVDLLWVTC